MSEIKVDHKNVDQNSCDNHYYTICPKVFIPSECPAMTDCSLIVVQHVKQVLPLMKQEAEVLLGGDPLPDALPVAAVLPEQQDELAEDI